MFSADLKRGSMGLLILSALEDEARHGYDIGKRIEHLSGGGLEFKVSTLYSALYRMEDRGWIKGRWVEKQGERRRCRYALTPEGHKVLARQWREWTAFSAMVNQVVGAQHA